MEGMGPTHGTHAQVCHKRETNPILTPMLQGKAYKQTHGMVG
ncbi:uncharacterized protein G2W53_037270 [Senna tora]|uniref:Uncharacterized protein n=1 Tax=Senna tora TaxID=362788 RepID=A0A834SYX2_9FABA|nr:uncharacterized protein G2W53_037270 [Senna tora]